MELTVGVPAETADGETRVALVPETVEQLTERAGMAVRVESGAGAAAHYTDEAYEAAGAVVGSREAALQADIVAVVRPLPDGAVSMLGPEQVIVGLLEPLEQPTRIERLAECGVTALAMELMPRISRAQSMDALSAMSSLAGYRAVLRAAHALPRFFPLLTTAAGTIKPANVLVIGAGVAGLQAIATAKRLGARVAGYDIRPAVKEEVESLGAGFVELELDTAAAETEDGYAEELQQEIQARQPELLQPYIAASDVVVTTALIPGRPAPMLIRESAVEAMADGSVIVDLAAPNGGNCALTVPGETIEAYGVTIMGPQNVPAEMAEHASQLYAQTVVALIETFVEEGRFVPDFDDDIFNGVCVAHDGAVTHDRVREQLAAA